MRVCVCAVIHMCPVKVRSAVGKFYQMVILPTVDFLPRIGAACGHATHPMGQHVERAVLSSRPAIIPYLGSSRHAFAVLLSNTPQLRNVGLGRAGGTNEAESDVTGRRNRDPDPGRGVACGGIGRGRGETGHPSFSDELVGSLKYMTVHNVVTVHSYPELGARC